MTELRTGTSVTPSLRLLRPLGQGGMGRVWVAEHLTLGTNVVVKFMSTDIAASADGAARFAREASVAAAVKSPHVVQVYDHGVTDEGDAYIVMELLEGRDLAAHLAANGPMAPGDVAALVAQVAKALGKAHQVGVVHRDIKPDNIFLCDGDGDGDGGELFVKLLDFGIAKSDQHRVSGAATTTGAVVGTPYYMSPEQIVGEKDIDARTDIWSLGVVAFEAMTGRRPFEGSTVGAITLSIHTATRRITDHLPAAPPALDAWFAHACARDPNQRFQSPREAAVALHEAVGDLVPAATPRIRAPMLSLVGDGSDPHLAAVVTGRTTTRDAAHDSPAATHLSSVFPVPRPTRSRPLVVGGAVTALLIGAIGAVFVIPALLRPTPPAVPTSGGASSSAQLGAPSSVAATASAPLNGVNAAGEDASAASALAAPSGDAATKASGTGAGASTTPTMTTPAAGVTGVTAATPGGATGTTTGGRPATPTTSLPAKPPTKPTKPGRTRDDDDIK